MFFRCCFAHAPASRATCAETARGFRWCFVSCEPVFCYVRSCCAMQEGLTLQHRRLRNSVLSLDCLLRPIIVAMLALETQNLLQVHGNRSCKLKIVKNWFSLKNTRNDQKTSFWGVLKVFARPRFFRSDKHSDTIFISEKLLLRVSPDEILVLTKTLGGWIDYIVLMTNVETIDSFRQFSFDFDMRLGRISCLLTYWNRDQESDFWWKFDFFVDQNHHETWPNSMHRHVFEHKRHSIMSNNNISEHNTSSFSQLHNMTFWRFLTFLVGRKFRKFFPSPGLNGKKNIFLRSTKFFFQWSIFHSFMIIRL